MTATGNISDGMMSNPKRRKRYSWGAASSSAQEKAGTSLLDGAPPGAISSLPLPYRKV